jgi:hypothetical protein
MSGCPLLEATSDLLGYDALPVVRKARHDISDQSSRPKAALRLH